MTKSIGNLFYDYSGKCSELTIVEKQLEQVTAQKKDILEEILNEPKLHDVLTTVGIVHDNIVYKKIPVINHTGHEAQSEGGLKYYLSTQNYTPPKHSFELIDSES